jgi:hypothetical protein
LRRLACGSSLMDQMKSCRSIALVTPWSPFRMSRFLAPGAGVALGCCLNEWPATTGAAVDSDALGAMSYRTLVDVSSRGLRFVRACVCVGVSVCRVCLLCVGCWPAVVLWHSDSWWWWGGGCCWRHTHQSVLVFPVPNKQVSVFGRCCLLSRCRRLLANVDERVGWYFDRF